MVHVWFGYSSCSVYSVRKKELEDERKQYRCKVHTGFSFKFDKRERCDLAVGRIRRARKGSSGGKLLEHKFILKLIIKLILRLILRFIRLESSPQSGIPIDVFCAE